MFNKLKLNLFALVNKFIDIYEIRTRRVRNLYNDLYSTNEKHFNQGIKLIILKDEWYLFRHYIDACESLQVNYKVVDILSCTWLEDIRDYKPDYIVARPTVVTSVQKEAFDRRLYLLKECAGEFVFPNFQELWIWESKLRMYDWLKVNEYPTPTSWTFYTKSEALAFVDSCSLPIVFKSNSGSGSRGVSIFASRSKLKRFVQQYFRKGFRAIDRHSLDTEWGALFLQQHLPNVTEWRIMRVGNSFFGYKKLPKDGMHSGSTLWEYGAIPENLLQFTYDLTQKHQMFSMALDIFVLNKKFYVNELQAYFGMEYKEEMCVVEGKAGRYLYVDDKWIFEEGSFCENKLCAERVKYLVDRHSLSRSGNCH